MSALTAGVAAAVAGYAAPMDADHPPPAGRSRGDGDRAARPPSEGTDGAARGPEPDRTAWLEASVEVGRELLGVTDEVGLVVQHIIDHVLRLGRARTVTFVGPSPMGEAHFEVRLATGRGAADLLGGSYLKERTLEGRAMQENRGFISPAGDAYCHHEHAEAEEPAGSLLAVPLDGPEEMRGAIVASRGASQDPFTPTELAMAQDFARQSSLALELAHGQATQEQLRFRERHDAEVRRLHDDLIQQLFGVGVMIEALRKSRPSPPGARRGPGAEASWRQVTDEVDAVIHQLRSTLTTAPEPEA